MCNIELLFFVLVLSVEPDAITFNKDGKEIIGVIILKNITTDKILSYKVFAILLCYICILCMSIIQVSQ